MPFSWTEILVLLAAVATIVSINWYFLFSDGNERPEAAVGAGENSRQPEQRDAPSEAPRDSG